MSSDQGAGTWRCGTCGAAHEGLAMVFGPQYPDPWVAATEEQRSRGKVDADVCVLPLDDQTHYFIRGELQLPVTDAADGAVFTWTVWSSLSRESMQATVDHWDDPGRASLPAMFGWLCTGLAPYDAPTHHLAVNVHHREPGLVPLVEVDPTSEHLLAREQREGITLHRVAELNRLLLEG